MGWRGVAFRLVGRVASVLDTSARALVHASAGLLGPPELRAAITTHWAGFGVNAAFVRSGLQPWEQTFYTRFLGPDDEILVVGCGSGRDLLALLRAGHRVDGLEPAAAAAGFARATLVAEGFDPRVDVGAIETAPLAKTYDAVVFSWYCYSYIPGRAARVAVLERVARHLAPGGRLLVSYLIADEPHARLIRLTRLVARLTFSPWRPQPADTLWAAPPGLHFEHHFTAAELEEEARAAGLVVAFHARGAEGTAVLTTCETRSRSSTARTRAGR